MRTTRTSMRLPLLLQPLLLLSTSHLHKSSASVSVSSLTSPLLRAKEDNKKPDDTNVPSSIPSIHPTIRPSTSPSIVISSNPTGSPIISELESSGDNNDSEVYQALADFDVYLEFVGDDEDVVDSSDILNELDRLTAKHLTSFISDSDLLSREEYVDSGFGFVSLSIKSFRQGEVEQEERRSLRSYRTDNAPNDGNAVAKIKGKNIRRLNVLFAEATFSGYAIFFSPEQSYPTTDELHQVQKDAFSNDEMALINYMTALRTSSDELLQSVETVSVSFKAPSNVIITDDNSTEGGSDGDSKLLIGGIAAAAAVVVVTLTVVYVWRHRKTPKTIYTRDTTDVSAMHAPEHSVGENVKPQDRYEERFPEETESVIMETQSALEARSVMSYDYSMDGYSLANRTKGDDDVSLNTYTQIKVPNLDEMSHGSITIPDTSVVKQAYLEPQLLNHQTSIGEDSVFSPSVASYIDDTELGQDDGSVWTYSNVGDGSPPVRGHQLSQNEHVTPSVLKPSSSSIASNEKKKVLNIGRSDVQISSSLKNRERSQQTVESYDPSYADNAELGQDDGSVWTYSNVAGGTTSMRALQPPSAQNQPVPPSILKLSPSSTLPNGNKKVLNIGRPVAQMSMSMSMNDRERSKQTVESYDPTLASIASIDSTDLEPTILAKSKRFKSKQKNIDKGLYNDESQEGRTSLPVKNGYPAQKYDKVKPRKRTNLRSQRGGPPSDVPSDEHDPSEQNLDNFYTPRKEKKKKNSLDKSPAIDDLDKLSRLIEDRQKNLRKIRRDRR